MEGQKSQKVLNLDDAKRTAIEIREAYKFFSRITKTLVEEIHKDFEIKRYSTKIWQLDAIKLADTVIARGCTDEIINAARSLLFIQEGIIKNIIRSGLCIPIPTNRLFKLTNVDRATVIWFTSAISEYHYKEQQKANSGEERKVIVNSERYCYNQLYEFLYWCQEQNISINFKDKNGIQDAIKMYVNRNDYAKHKTGVKWLKGIVESLQLVGFIALGFLNEILQRIGVCEGFNQELVAAVDEFISMKSDPNKPRRFYVEGFGNIPNKKRITYWKLKTRVGARRRIFGLYGYYCVKENIPRSQVTLWSPKKEHFENVPVKHTSQWWAPLESWLGYLDSRPDIPKSYKKEILEILKNPTLVPNGEGKKPVFLTPLELVKVEKLLETIPTDGHAMKTKIMFLLGCLAGLRACEIVRVTFNMFDRDPETGQLILEQGRAILRLPYMKTKGEYCPSHPVFGTIIVPYLAKIINAYLKSNAMEGAVAAANQGKKSKDVYLVHKGKHWSEGKLSDGYVISFFQKHKDILSKALVHHPAGMTFSSQDLRHSCNDLILSIAIRWRSNVRIAEIHERHNQSRRGSSVNIRHYSRDVSKNAYYNAVSYALGFPWDEASVKEWMKGKGYDEKGELPDELTGSYLELLLGIPQSSTPQLSNQQIIATGSNNNSNSGVLKEVKETVSRLKETQKRVQLEVKNGIIRNHTARERLQVVREQAIAKIKQLKCSSPDEAFQFACEQAIENMQKER